MAHRNLAIIPFPVLSSLKGINHLFYQIINVHQLQLCGWVVNLDRKIIGDIVAESSHSRVVVRSAPLSKKVRESVHQNFSPGSLAVLKEKLLTLKLTLTILRICKSSL